MLICLSAVSCCFSLSDLEGTGSAPAGSALEDVTSHWSDAHKDPIMPLVSSKRTFCFVRGEGAALHGRQHNAVAEGSWVFFLTNVDFLFRNQTPSYCQKLLWEGGST